MGELIQLFKNREEHYDLKDLWVSSRLTYVKGYWVYQRRLKFAFIPTLINSRWCWLTNYYEFRTNTGYDRDIWNWKVHYRSRNLKDIESAEFWFFQLNKKEKHMCDLCRSVQPDVFIGDELTILRRCTKCHAKFGLEPGWSVIATPSMTKVSDWVYRSVEEKTPEVKCECGAHAVGSDNHSSCCNFPKVNSVNINP